jgi:hypothetical protein
MKKITAFLMVATGLIISCIAGFVSVFGMIALFAGHAIVIGTAIGSIEFGKVVASAWLKLNWNNKGLSWWHRTYLLVSIGSILILTSMGIFGYFSAAYFEKNAPMGNLKLQEEGYDRQIDQKKAEIVRLEARTNLLDKNVESFLKSDKASGGLRASASLKKERDSLQKQINDDYAIINDLSNKVLPLKQQTVTVEAKLGPAKNVADLFGITNPDAAVRMIIALIMIVFDPLAIVLMLAGLVSYNEFYEERLLKASRKAKEDDDAVSAPSEPVMVPEEPVVAIMEPSPIMEPEPVVPEPLPELLLTEEVPVELAVDPFKIVHDLNTPVAELPEEEAVEEVDPTVSAVKETPNADYRERLINFLQDEPGLATELEIIINQLAEEKAQKENIEKERDTGLPSND